MAGNLSLKYVIHRVGTDTYEQSFMTLIQIRNLNYFRREQIHSQFFKLLCLSSENNVEQLVLKNPTHTAQKC